MKVFVKAKPKSKEESVEKIDGTHFVISVKEPPLQGRANMAIAKALAEHFHIPVFNIKMVSGFSSKQKTFEFKM